MPQLTITIITKITPHSLSFHVTQLCPQPDGHKLFTVEPFFQVRHVTTMSTHFTH